MEREKPHIACDRSRLGRGCGPWLHVPGTKEGCRYPSWAMDPFLAWYDGIAARGMRGWPKRGKPNA